MLRWDGMRCAGNSMYFNEVVHALSYQRSPSQCSVYVYVCVNAPLCPSLDAQCCKLLTVVGQLLMTLATVDLPCLP